MLDSGFCVLKGIAELKKKGVFAASLIKKRCYRPKYVDGDAINQHFSNKEVGGATDALCGTLEEVPVSIHCLKEPDYIMMLMSSYGTLMGCGEGEKTALQKNAMKTDLIQVP